MAGFLSKLFGGKSDDGGAKAGKPVEYRGLSIVPAPERSGGQWRLVGSIVKAAPDGPMERTFSRADTFASRDEAESFAVRKGKQIIDERGDNLFADGAATGRV